MKKLVLLLIFPALVFCQTGKVVRIKDGDTVVVLDSLNHQTTIRLAEVDCPENSQAFGKKAKEFTAQEVGNKNVTYKVVNTDRYGRTVAKIFYDNGKYLSAEIIKAGYGWWYYKYSNSKELRTLEEKAKNKKSGLWSDSNAIAPWEYRHSRKGNP